MSGRGLWWDVNTHSPELGGIKFVGWKQTIAAPSWATKLGIDKAVAKLAHEGDEDAVSAVLECPDDMWFQAAVRRHGEKE